MLCFTTPLPRFAVLSPQGGQRTDRALSTRFVIPQACNAGYSGRAGFTLIELLVVILIIGILAAIALPQYQKAVARARAQEALLYVREVVREQRLYFLEHSEWVSLANQENLPFAPKLPKNWGIHEWFPGSRITLRSGKYNMYIYDFYSLSTERIQCKAENSASAIAACSALSNGNEDTDAADWRRVFNIQ